MAKARRPRQSAGRLTRQNPAAKRAALARRHCEALVKANKRLDEFQEARTAFYQLVFKDERGNWKRFRAAVQRAQRALTSTEFRRVNDGEARIKGWFDWLSGAPGSLRPT